MLPHKPPYRLALDRTNWKFGTTDINILFFALVLVALVLVAFVWAYKIGDYLNELKPIKIKNHGRKSKTAPS